MPVFGKRKESQVDEQPGSSDNDNSPSGFGDARGAETKSFWSKLWPVLACGSGLFSDGYVQSVIGPVNTVLSRIYPSYSSSTAYTNVASIAFAGTVLGQLLFGYTSDHWSRTNSLLISTIIIILFTALAAGSYGYHGSQGGMFAALTAYRFFLGIGVGGEYPAGSVACSESTGELKEGTRNRWFIMFTNVMIDWGFVIGTFVPYVCLLIFTEDHLRAMWRVSLGLGVVPPLILLVLRLKLKEPEEFNKESMTNCKVPYGLIVRFYGLRLLAVSAIWFLYDFSSYSFSIYSTPITESIIGTNAPLSQSFGWAIVINLFYLPGAMFGGFFSDWIGPRYALIIGVTLQSLVGFIMAGLYGTLSHEIGAFAVVYGIFLSLGELGPGDNIGLIASKTSATAVRGQYYGIAAAVGKIGAFVGTYVFPHIADAGSGDAAYQYPFYVSSSLCLLSAAIALFCLPHIGQDTITREDVKFREYLESRGWDTRQMGKNTMGGLSEESRLGTEQVVSGKEKY